jgi:hypothetical protein
MYMNGTTDDKFDFIQLETVIVRHDTRADENVIFAIDANSVSHVRCAVFGSSHIAMMQKLRSDTRLDLTLPSTTALPTANSSTSQVAPAPPRPPRRLFARSSEDSAAKAPEAKAQDGTGDQPVAWAAPSITTPRKLWRYGRSVLADTPMLAETLAVSNPDKSKLTSDESDFVKIANALVTDVNTCLFTDSHCRVFAFVNGTQPISPTAHCLPVS